MNVAARPRPRPRLAGPALRAPVVVAAGLSLWSGYIHFVYLQSHWQEWWAYGAFFLAAGVGQALYAPLLLRFRWSWLLLAGIAGNVAILGMYLLSRTAGPPLGPHARAIEPAGVADLATAACEVVLVGILIALLGRRARTLIINALLVAGAALWALRLTGHLA
jgi:hypothetical protein